MRSSRFLCGLAAAIALLNISCSSTRFVPVMPPIPSACSEVCRSSGAPVLARDNRERTEQEIRLLDERDACIALHAACHADLERQISDSIEAR